MMRNVVRASACVFASAWLGAGVAWAQDRPLTTAEIVQRALDNNREVLAARQRVGEAQGLLRQAGVRLAPTVELDSSTGRPLGTHGEEEYSASYFHPIETAGKRPKRVTVAQQSVTLAQAELADRTRQLLFDVKARITELRVAQRKVDCRPTNYGRARSASATAATRWTPQLLRARSLTSTRTLRSSDGTLRV